MLLASRSVLTGQPDGKYLATLVTEHGLTHKYTYPVRQTPENGESPKIRLKFILSRMSSIYG